MKLPKLYRPIEIEFWSLRDGLGDNYGMIFDNDERVKRICMRVIVPGGWKWQIINMDKIFEWDYEIFKDQDCLDEYAMDTEDLSYQL